MLFKFDNLSKFCIGLIFIMLMFFVFSFTAVMRGELGSGIAIFIIFVPLTMLAGVVGILNVMDIFVSDAGISRRFLGFTAQSIAWDDLKLVRIFNINDRTIGVVHCFNFFPKTPSGFRLVPSGKIVFSDQMSDFSEFKKLVNEYIKRVDVKIERMVNGTSVSEEEL